VLINFFKAFLSLGFFYKEVGDFSSFSPRPTIVSFLSD